MIIDAFTHALTDRYYQTLLDEYGFPGMDGDPSFLWDMEGRLADMDEFGIDKHVLTIALPPIFRGMDHPSALALTKLANDEIRRLTDEHPDRLIPVGTIPKVDDAFIDEFDRCVSDLDMRGIQIFSTIDGAPLDRPQFDPLFAKAASEDTPLWLHPQLHDWHPWTSEYMDHVLFGWPFDTTLALSRLVFGGVTDRHDFEIVSHHGGGMLPLYDGRIDGFYETRLQYPERYPETELPSFEQPVSDVFAEFYADSALGASVGAHQRAHEFFGDTFVFGTDYPFGPSGGRGNTAAGLNAIEGMDISPDARRGILSGNVLELLE